MLPNFSFTIKVYKNYTNNLQMDSFVSVRVIENIGIKQNSILYLLNKLSGLAFTQFDISMLCYVYKHAVDR